MKKGVGGLQINKLIDVVGRLSTQVLIQYVDACVI